MLLISPVISNYGRVSLSSHLEAILMLGLYFSPISWSNSDVGGVLLCPWASCVQMLLIIVMLFISLRSNSWFCFVLMSWSKSDAGVVFFPHILKQFWCWDFLFSWHLEAILMLGVFCCAHGPVVFRCNCFCGVSCYLSLFWEASLEGLLLSSHFEAILMLGLYFPPISWSNSDVGGGMLCPWASCVQW